jgi:hypothetical protein
MPQIQVCSCFEQLKTLRLAPTLVGALIFYYSCLPKFTDNIFKFKELELIRESMLEYLPVIIIVVISIVVPIFWHMASETKKNLQIERTSLKAIHEFGKPFTEAELAMRKLIVEEISKARKKGETVQIPCASCGKNAQWSGYIGPLLCQRCWSFFCPGCVGHAIDLDGESVCRLCDVEVFPMDALGKLIHRHNY